MPELCYCYAIFYFLKILLAILNRLGYNVFVASDMGRAMQVSYIGSTPASQAGKVGSTPITCSDMKLNEIPQVQPQSLAGFRMSKNSFHLRIFGQSSAFPASKPANT